MLEMRPLARPQLFCFGTSGSRHPAFIAELVQMSAEEGRLGKESSGVCGLGNSGPHFTALLLSKGNALVTCLGAGISFVSSHWGGKEGSDPRCLGKISANWTRCWQCTILAVTQGCKGLGVPRCGGRPPEAFPSWSSVPEPTCRAFKKADPQPQKSPHLLQTSSCHRSGQVWVTPSWGSGIWLRRMMFLSLCYSRSWWHQLGRDGPAGLAAYRRSRHLRCRTAQEKVTVAPGEALGNPARRWSLEARPGKPMAGRGTRSGSPRPGRLRRAGRGGGESSWDERAESVHARAARRSAACLPWLSRPDCSL